MRLFGADIAGNLEMSGGSICNPYGVAWHGDGIQIGGSLYLRAGFSAVGEVRLISGRIGADVDFSHGRFRSARGNAIAINADGVRVAGRWRFLGRSLSEWEDASATAYGEVRLTGAEITGAVDFGGGNIINPGGRALSAFGLRTSGSVLLNNRFVAQGTCSLSTARIGGGLDCSGGLFLNPGETALFAEAATVGGFLLLRRRFLADGAIRLLGTQIAGGMDCEGGSFNGSAPDGLALDELAAGPIDRP